MSKRTGSRIRGTVNGQCQLETAEKTAGNSNNKDIALEFQPDSSKNNLLTNYASLKRATKRPSHYRHATMEFCRLKMKHDQDCARGLAARLLNATSCMFRSYMLSP